MSKTQLNITIEPELLLDLKRNSIKSGKTLSQNVSDIISQFLSTKKASSSPQRLDLLERKILVLERKLSDLSTEKQKITPFNEVESKNYSEFMREVFNQKIRKSQNINRKKAFDELVKQIDCFHQWDQFYTMRLKEVLFLDDFDPFSAKELNHLTLGKECPCPIRTGLINWINGSKKGQCSCSNRTFPSQQQICENGSVLAKNFARTIK